MAPEAFAANTGSVMRRPIVTTAHTRPTEDITRIIIPGGMESPGTETACLPLLITTGIGGGTSITIASPRCRHDLIAPAPRPPDRGMDRTRLRPASKPSSATRKRGDDAPRMDSPLREAWPITGGSVLAVAETHA